MNPNLPTPEDFDAKLRALLSNAEIEPPADMWSRIEREVETRKSRRGPIILYMRSQWVSAAAIVTIFTLGFGLWTSQNLLNTPNQDLVALVLPADDASQNNGNEVHEAIVRKPHDNASLAQNSKQTSKPNDLQAQSDKSSAGSNGQANANPKPSVGQGVTDNQSIWNQNAYNAPAKGQFVAQAANTKPKGAQAQTKPHQYASLRNISNVKPEDYEPIDADVLQQWLDQAPAVPSIMVASQSKPQGPLPQVAWKNEVKHGPLSIAAHFRPEYAQQAFAMSNGPLGAAIQSENTGFTSLVNNPGIASAGIDQNILRQEASSLDRPLAPEFSFNTGVEVAYRIVGQLSVSAGVDYSQMQNSRTSSTYLYNPITQERTTLLAFDLTAKDPTQFMLAADAQKPVVYSQNLQYIGLPIRTSYEVGKGSVRFFATAGVAPQVLAQASVLQDGAAVPTNILPYNNVYLTAQFSAGMSVGLGQKYSLQIEPSYRLAVTSVTNTEVASSYPYMVGVGLRLRAHL